MEQQDVMKAFAQAVSPFLEQGNKAAGTPSQTAYIYETGGLFGRCDGPGTLINAMVGPVGVEKALTWIGNDTEREIVDALKSIQETGSEQSSVCGDCVRVSTKACAQFYCFGRFCRQTEELQFDRIGMKANANVPVKTLFGSITNADGSTVLGSGEQIRDAFYLQARAVGYALRLKNSMMLWDRNPANNNGDSYQEYMGFQLIVNTGKYDVYTQLACPSIDSFLTNFAYQNPQSTGTYAIQNWFRRQVGQFVRRAEGAGMDWGTAQMYIVMDHNQWDCVAKAYACSGLDLCAGVSTSRVLTQSADQARTRYEGYLESMSLPIYGRNYPVILDSQIPKTTGQANGTCSDIYFLVTEINGQAVLYGEYQDFNRTYGAVRSELTSMFGSDDIAITDNGRYALVRDNSRGCFDIQGYTKPRLVSVAPWLLGRIQNVCCNVQHQPYPDVTGSGFVYETDGGRSTTPVPVMYGSCPETLS